MTDVDISAPEITSDGTRQRYELEEMGRPDLDDALRPLFG